jgi:hypothetical protein
MDGGIERDRGGIVGYVRIWQGRRDRLRDKEWYGIGWDGELFSRISAVYILIFILRAEWTAQGSTLRTVRLPGTTRYIRRAIRFLSKLAQRTIKYFAFLLIFNRLDK